MARHITAVLILLLATPAFSGGISNTARSPSRVQVLWDELRVWWHTPTPEPKRAEERYTLLDGIDGAPPIMGRRIRVSDLRGHGCERRIPYIVIER